MKDSASIPKGSYCYTWLELPSKDNKFKGKVKMCPYYTEKLINNVSVPWCNFLNLGSVSNNWNELEWERVKEYYDSRNKDIDKELPLFLLWDAVKECGENLDDECGKSELA